jgi:GT2 family glycosyltransferase
MKKTGKKKYRIFLSAKDSLPLTLLMPCIQDEDLFVLVESEPDLVLECSGIAMVEVNELNRVLSTKPQFPYVGIIGTVDPGNGKVFTLDKTCQIPKCNCRTASYFILREPNDFRSTLEILSTPRDNHNSGAVALELSTNQRLHPQIKFEDSCQEIIAGKIDIVIPTRFSGNENGMFLSNLLQSLNYSEDTHINKIILVYDVNSVAHVDHRFLEDPKIALIPYEKTFNFSDKVNLGVKNSLAEYIVLMNDDMRSLTEDWSSRVLDVLKDESAGIMGCLLLYPSLKIQHAGIYVQRNHLKHLFSDLDYEKIKLKNFAKGYLVTAVTGAFMGVSRKNWDRALGFDNLFSINFGDVDFCLRMGSLGLKILQNNQVIFEHLESATRTSGNVFAEHKYLRIRWRNKLLRDVYFKGLFSNQLHLCRS